MIYNPKSGKCEACNKKKYIDLATKSCIDITCKIQTPKFNLETKQCEACGNSESVDPNDYTKCIKTNYVGLCPPSTPLYDFTDNTCKACPAGTSFDQALKACAAGQK